MDENISFPPSVECADPLLDDSAVIMEPRDGFGSLSARQNKPNLVCREREGGEAGQGEFIVVFSGAPPDNSPIAAGIPSLVRTSSCLLEQKGVPNAAVNFLSCHIF